MIKLTLRQEEILARIREHIATHGFPPTRVEIAQAFGFSSVTAAEGHLRALARKGVIELLPTSRGIRMLEKAGLPIVGKVAAGSPILAEQNLLGHCEIDPTVFKPRADYLLQVRGMSMRDVGIFDGDWIAVHRTSEAHTGQIVVARIDDEVTVKRLRFKRGQPELLPENPDFKPLIVDVERQTFNIEGLYVGLVRR